MMQRLAGVTLVLLGLAMGAVALWRIGRRFDREPEKFPLVWLGLVELSGVFMIFGLDLLFCP